MAALTALLMIAMTAPHATPAGAPSMRTSRASICAESRQLLAEARTAFQTGRVRTGSGLARAALLDHGVKIAVDGGADAAPLRLATGRWNQALGEEVFQVVPVADADIVVEEISELGGDEQGQVDTEVKTSSNGAYSLSGAIEVCDNCDGQLLGKLQIAEVLTHELGHVLGLDDDRAGGGIMGTFDPAHLVEGPSTAEVAAVLAFRSEASRLLKGSRW